MLSIVISWRDRRELIQALPGLVASARCLGGDLTIVNFGGSHDALSQQIAGYEQDIQIVRSGEQPFFSKAAAQNLGAASTRQPVLFFCDCDILLDPELVRSVLEKLTNSPATFATIAGVRETERNSRGAHHITRFGYELRLRTANGRELHIVDHEEDADNGARQAPGLLFVRRDDFLSVNGYNSRLIGWGWEDQDMISRLTLGAGLTRINHGYALHISHDDEARVKAYPIANRWESRDKAFRQALANYDRADFRGTYDLDVSALRAQQALTVPSRLL